MSGKWNKTMWMSPPNHLLQWMEWLSAFLIVLLQKTLINTGLDTIIVAGIIHLTDYQKSVLPPVWWNCTFIFVLILLYVERWPVLKLTVCRMSCTHFNLLFSWSGIHLELCLRNLSLPSDFRTLHHLHWKEMQPARLRWKTDAVAAPLIQSTNPQLSLSVRKKYF